MVRFSPQRNDNELKYTFDGEAITATLNRESDSFDFSGLREGDEVAQNPKTGQLEIETSLPVLPILDARRENGQLIVTVLKYHGKDAPKEERFPQPLEVK